MQVSWGVFATTDLGPRPLGMDRRPAGPRVLGLNSAAADVSSFCHVRCFYTVDPTKTDIFELGIQVFKLRQKRAFLTNKWFVCYPQQAIVFVLW